MGKKKNKKGAGGLGKHALPKRIAGVKIPKQLRKSGGQALALAETPMIKKIIASGLVAAAAAMANTDAGKKSAGKAKDGLKQIKDGGIDGTSDLAAAVGMALNSAMEHWFGRRLDLQRTDGEERPRPDDAATVRH